MKSLLSKFNWLPPLFARISVGWVFVESGWGKLQNLPRVVEYFASLSIPFPELHAPFVASVELAAGILLIFGLATRLASIPLIGIMIVAILTAKLPEIEFFSDVFGFSEFLYILLLFWLVTNGPGLVSVDHFISKYLKEKI